MLVDMIITTDYYSYGVSAILLIEIVQKVS